MTTQQHLDIDSEDVQCRLVAEDKFAFAILSNMPIVSGHLLIFPKRPVAVIDRLTNEELSALFKLISKLKEPLKLVFGAEGFNYAWNEGGVAGQSLNHLHIHMLPRKKCDQGITQYEPRQFLYRPGSRTQSPRDELANVAEKLRKHL